MNSHSQDFQDQRPHSGSGKDDLGGTWTKGVPDGHPVAYVNAYLDVRTGDVIRGDELQPWRLVVSHLTHDVSCTCSLVCHDGYDFYKIRAIFKMHPVKADEWLQQQGITCKILSK